MTDWLLIGKWIGILAFWFAPCGFPVWLVFRLPRPNWKYVNAEKSRKPGYLARRFDYYRKRQKEQASRATALAAEVQQKVRKLGGKI